MSLQPTLLVFFVLFCFYYAEVSAFFSKQKASSFGRETSKHFIILLSKHFIIWFIFSLHTNWSNSSQQAFRNSTFRKCCFRHRLEEVVPLEVDRSNKVLNLKRNDSSFKFKCTPINIYDRYCNPKLYKSQLYRWGLGFFADIFQHDLHLQVKIIIVCLFVLFRFQFFVCLRFPHLYPVEDETKLKIFSRKSFKLVVHCFSSDLQMN